LSGLKLDSTWYNVGIVKLAAVCATPFLGREKDARLPFAIDILREVAPDDIFEEGVRQCPHIVLGEPVQNCDCRFGEKL
jgi:hypothetical protein